LKCPICGDKRTRLKGTCLTCKACGAVEQVIDNQGRIVPEEVWNILLDARAVAKYLKNLPPGIE